MLWLIQLIEESHVYWLAVQFYGLYPIVTSLIWMTTAIAYFFRHDLAENHDDLAYTPFVSILTPAYYEEDSIAAALEGLVRIDYPNYEIIVINDGSKDKTVELVKPFLSDHRVRLLDKQFNEGKAMALNDAILCARGDLILVMDADTIPEPQVLTVMVQHFKSPNVGAVAGNARVRNRTNWLSRLQAVEFSSVIGLLRRAQRVWGRVMCVSGVCGMFRKEALIQAGLYSPGMATEDIDLTFKLQRNNFEIRYEARALVWMEVPEDLGVLWRQRCRWAVGLGQALKRHMDILWSPKHYRLYPVYIESFFSVLWAWVFVAITSFWAIGMLCGHSPYGGSPIPNYWGVMIFTCCLGQLLVGVIIDAKYEREVLYEFPFAIFYPCFYWMVMSLSSAIHSTKGFAKRLNLAAPVTWRVERQSAN
jgi:biofilm PGA synthesis N-glycosyltransferase PgaC